MSRYNLVITETNYTPTVRDTIVCVYDQNNTQVITIEFSTGSHVALSHREYVGKIILSPYGFLELVIDRINGEHSMPVDDQQLLEIFTVLNGLSDNNLQMIKSITGEFLL